MTDNPRHPWPASWPPFWRGALHVAIAAGVGNVAFAVVIPIFIRGDLWDVMLISWATTILTAIVPAILSRMGERTYIALMGGFSLGWLMFGPLSVYIFYSMAGPSGRDSSVVSGLTVVVLALVFPASYTITAFFVRCASCESIKRPRMSWIVGGCLLFAAVLWASVAFRVGIGWWFIGPGKRGHLVAPPPALQPFVNLPSICISAFVLFNVAYAVMAVMLISNIKTAEDHW